MKGEYSTVPDFVIVLDRITAGPFVCTKV